MKIYATFANRKYDPDVVELVHAWDELCLDENPTGYDDTKKESLSSWGEDLLHHVTVEVDIDAGPIYHALTGAVQIAGRVQVCSSE